MQNFPSFFIEKVRVILNRGNKNYGVVKSSN